MQGRGSLWFLLGAAAGISLVTVALVSEAKNIRYVSDMSGDYELDMVISPGRIKRGNQQSIIVRLSKNGKPVPDASVKLEIQQKSGTETKVLTTDVHGEAILNLVSFTAQSMTFTAQYTTQQQSKVQVSATGTWCNCGA